MVADNLGLQMIIVTTLPEFLNVADRIYNVDMDKNGKSQLKLIKGGNNE